MTTARCECALEIRGPEESAPNRPFATVGLGQSEIDGRAHQWSEDLLMGRAQSATEIAEREGVADRHVRRLMRLAFLAPEIVEAIVAGSQPPELTAEALAERIDLPLFWSAQEQAVGIR